MIWPSLVVLKLLLYSAVDDSWLVTARVILDDSWLVTARVILDDPWLVTARVILSNSRELLMVVRVDIYITIGPVPRSAWTKRERSHCMFLIFCYMIMMRNNKLNFDFN